MLDGLLKLKLSYGSSFQLKMIKTNAFCIFDSFLRSILVEKANLFLYAISEDIRIDLFRL